MDNFRNLPSCPVCEIRVSGPGRCFECSKLPLCDIRLLEKEIIKLKSQIKELNKELVRSREIVYHYQPTQSEIDRLNRYDLEFMKKWRD